MNLNKLIPPAALFAMLALFAPHANAQTMGEYATATAGVATGGGSMGTNFGPASIGANSVSGSSGTWAANGLGASFEERAGAASASSAGGDFESRAGSLTSSSTGEPRWPQSRFSSDNSSFGGGDSSNRFGDTSSRFCDQGRFNDRSEFSSSDDRFPASAFNDNRNGLDTNYNSINKF